MKKAILLILLFVSTGLSAQEQILQGKIVDENQSALAYVNIGLIGTTVGTVSNSEGLFKLTIKDLSQLINSTLRVSSIGYETQEFALNSVVKDGELMIVMKASTQQLNDVIITPSDTKVYTEGRDKTNTARQVNFSISTAQNQNLGSEIGRKFELSNRKDNYLKNFKFYIKYNDFDQVKFRINIYTLEDGVPSEYLNSQNLIIEITDKKTGWIEVDLSELNLVVRGDIAIGAEWIEHSKNGRRLSLPMIVPSIGSTHFYKYGSQSDWKKFSSLSSAMLLTYEK
ncbi:carboxypeptidase-like protein [Roseivirga ehrenbergii]|uniref:TonB-dependent receptor plug domain-containing protein n=1 Tax=Roseivirga ehrenbergii (strain DSM 102268 / JCM 13514 / KCTC 12282 / NCIMB 14502 / KMM 6017) TaxID=279360 RepID=A0A150X0I7_ROSEK|nr:carboxypeptidase-like regulatory domain-containing protein [Roseivirga ehrenbergii]KYG72227.1 hypothetical protein MB14_09305 [Roseivirga ehrenbergii]TCL13466.1 carboxypeptidase-like protein [Roseivirga ehrenbergii]